MNLFIYPNSEVDSTLKILRQVATHDQIIFGNPGLVEPVKDNFKRAQRLSKTLGGVCDGRLDAEALAEAAGFDHKVARKQAAALAKALDKIV